ncbi:hypothetical protein EVAR_4681_1 [Eumeta japonica]|uniref:Uncharacterized protein n=1 Tax=Eumeta variegata TaxID=151549 RepID=A0A4C1WLV7_EUMVA|nr:hypothetical protein EVAR_4681_1 [Eumeta japonica]
MQLFANIHNLVSLKNNFVKVAIINEEAASEKSSLESLRRNVVLRILEQLMRIEVLRAQAHVKGGSRCEAEELGVWSPSNESSDTWGRLENGTNASSPRQVRINYCLYPGIIMKVSETLKPFALVPYGLGVLTTTSPAGSLTSPPRQAARMTKLIGQFASGHH